MPMYQPMGLVRALRLLLVWYTVGSMWDTAALSLWGAGSHSYRLASMTGYPEVVGWLFIVAIALMIPFAAVNLSVQADSANRSAARLAALGAMTAALLWVGMAYTGRHAELGMLRISYLRSALEAVLFAILIGATVNDQLKRSACLTTADFGESNRVDLK